MNTAAAFLDRHRHLLSGVHATGTPMASVILTPRFRASRHVVFLLIPEGHRQPTLVAKIPRLSGTTTSLDNEHEILRALQALRPEGFSSVPRVVAFAEYCGRSVLLETAMIGPLMGPEDVQRDLAGCSTLVIDWLVDVHQASRQPGASRWVETLVEPPLRDLAERLPASATDLELIARTREVIAGLRGAELPFVCEHGDLSHPNLVRSPQGLAVIDWELGRLAGQVAYDLFIYLAYAAASRTRARTLETRLAAFDEAFFGGGAWARPFVQAYCSRVGLPPHLLTPLFVLAWARSTSMLLHRLADTEPGAREPVAPATAAAVRANRYFRMWQHAVTHADRLHW